MNSTLKYYENNAQEFIENTINKEMSTQYKTFQAYLKKESHILDAGCGSGRDSLYFKSQGYQVTAFDASRKMCDFASELLEQEVLELSFDDILFEKQFDAIWASASLLHINKESMPEILIKLAKALKSEGILYASFKAGEKEFIKEDRYFNSYTQENFTKLVKTSPFHIKEVFLLADSRPEKEGEFWLNAVLGLNCILAIDKS